MAFRGVLFDLGGVVLDSPLAAIAALERERGIPEGHVNRVIVDAGPGGAWSRLERGELPLDAFFGAFERECEAAGHRISARTLMARIAAAARPRPEMLAAVARIRARGLVAAALTNNWAAEGGDSRALRDHFDHFFESSVLGLRKPDPRIYEHACSVAGLPPRSVVFLDDIGRNLKAARALGMATVKVDEPAGALVELEALLGFPLQEDPV